MLDRIANRRQRPLVVLTYHRIAVPGTRSDPYYDPVISATPESFERQLRYIGRRFRFVSVEELRDQPGVNAAIARGDRPPLLVTFDDGYRDNFETAAPILQKLGIPALFFIPTSFLTQPTLPWWDHAACILKRTEAERLVLNRSRDDQREPLEIRLPRDPDDGARTAAIKRVIDLFLAGDVPDESWFLAQLQEQAGVSLDTQALGRELFMSWDQLRALIKTGMSVGSHGHAHAALGRLDDEAERRDLEESKRILEAELGREMTAVAYPYGWAGTFSPRTQHQAAQAGYQLGFSSLEGVNRPDSGDFEPFRLRRLNVGAGDSGLLLRARAALHGAYGSSFL